MSNGPPPEPADERLRALVVEDEWPARNYLVELIEGSELAEVVGAVSGVDDAREVLNSKDGVTIDVVFVDVQLAGSGSERAGLDWARSEFGNDCRRDFVIATAFEQHAIEAFELGAFDYLLKPFSPERIVHCLQRLRARRPRNTNTGPSRIVARKKRNLVFLDPGEILAFEAADRMTFAHTERGVFDLDLSLLAIENSFGRAFVRTHRSWLVNLKHVRELERNGTETRLLVGRGPGMDAQGLSVQVARERTQEIREALLLSATGLKRS